MSPLFFFRECFPSLSTPPALYENTSEICAKKVDPSEIPIQIEKQYIGLMATLR